MGDKISDPDAHAKTKYEGFMLKKKRKKMQGMARRYFRLSEGGSLSYSFRPDTETRDSVLVSRAYVSASRKLRTFHIDTGSYVWHCKALTADDFEKWTTALRACSANLVEHQNAPTPSSASKSKGGRSVADSVDLPAIQQAVKKMASPIQELENLVTELKSHEHSPAQSSSPNQSSVLKFLKNPVGGGSSSTSSSKKDDYLDAKPTHDQLVKQLAQLLSTLKAQHDSLSKKVNGSTAYSSRGGLPAFDNMPASAYGSRSLGGRAPSRASSVASSETNDDYEDALPGEFVLEEEGYGSEDEHDGGHASSVSSASPSPDEEGYDSAHSSDTSFTSVESESEDEDEDGGRAQKGDAERDTDTDTLREDDSVERRQQLPSAVVGDDSVLGVLRRNIGKDLSQISMPVTMNEPLSALQRLAEETLEYSELLDQASGAKDSIERLTLVTAWAVAANSGSKFKGSRKPFNPLLGETYECVRPERGARFVAEKVSHHPPLLAFYGESKRKSWTVYGHVAPASKFYGRSMEVSVTGDVKVAFKDGDDVYSIQRPPSYVRNLMAGTKYIETVGQLTVTNEETGEKATVDFKEGTTWGGASSRNKIEGKVMDDEGNVKVELVGKWDEQIDRKDGKDSFTRLWRVHEFPPHAAQRYYGFSQFAVELNEKTSIEEKHVAPTDCRLRPDQLALERGDVDEAEKEKKRLEEKQREKRKKGDNHVPKWFAKKGDSWHYGGGYFEAREKGEFDDPDIF